MARTYYRNLTKAEWMALSPPEMARVMEQDREHHDRLYREFVAQKARENFRVVCDQTGMSEKLREE